MTGDTSRNCDTPNHSSIQTLCIKLCTVSLSLCLMGCAPVSSDTAKNPTAPEIPATSSPQTISPQAKPKPVSELAQYLPITAIATISGREIQLEVASTFKEQEKGLMFRPHWLTIAGCCLFLRLRVPWLFDENTPSRLILFSCWMGKLRRSPAMRQLARVIPVLFILWEV